MKIFSTFSNTFNKRNAIIALGLLFALFLFPQFGFTEEMNLPINENQQEAPLEFESMSYDFPDFVATIHSKPEGGNWNSQSTWEEGVIPDENDFVEINGIVTLNTSYPTRHYYVSGIKLKEHSTLHKTNGSATLHIQNILLTEDQTTIETSIIVHGNVYHYGTFNRISAYSNIYNHGSIGEIYYEPESPVFLVNDGEINNLQLNNNLTLKNSLKIENELTLSQYSLFFENENNNNLYVGKISASTNAETIIDGHIFLSKKNRLDVLKLRAKSLTLKEGVGMQLLCYNQVINAPVILKQNAYFYAPAQHTCWYRDGDIKSILMEGLSLDEGASIFDENRQSVFEVYGPLLNHGTIYGKINFHNDIENHGDIFTIKNSSPYHQIYIGGSSTQKSISGLEDYDLWIYEGESTFTHPLHVKKITASGRNGIIPTIRFDSSQNAYLYVKNGMTIHDSNGNSHFNVQGTVVFEENKPHSLSGTLKSQLTIIKENASFVGGTLVGPTVFKGGSSVGGTLYNGWYHRMYINGDVIIEPNVSFVKARLYASTAYVYGSMDFRGSEESFGRTTYVYPYNPNKNDGPYIFEYMKDGIFESVSVDNENQNLVMNIKDILLDRNTHFIWRTKSANTEWSPWFTVNKTLYLEEDNRFFTSSDIQNITENEEVEVSITASDDYTGDLKLSIDEGGVSPNIVHMENGSVTVNLSFDTPQEFAQLHIKSQDHVSISGISNTFTILHQIEYNFFSVPAISEGEQEREMQITLHAREVDYLGDVIIHYYYKKEDESFEHVIIPNVSLSGGEQTIFSFIPENITSESYFTFIDGEKDYLRGESNHFFVKKKPSRIGGSIRKRSPQIVGDTFLSQGEGDGEEQGSSPPNAEESGPAEQNDSEDTETPADQNNQDAEDNENDEIAPEYLLENGCWNIHSTFSVLSKSLRSQLRDDDDEKQNVKNLQQKLKNLHFLSGSIDGDFGNQTEQALKDFQRQNNLYVDGVFGSETSNYVKDNCETLQVKQEEEQGDAGDQNPPNDDENDDEGGEQSSPPDDSSWIEDIFGGIGNWFSNTWLGGLFGGGNEHNQEIQVEIKKTLEDSLRIIQDDKGHTVVEIIDRASLDELAERYNLHLPDKDKMVFDEDGNEISIQEELPEEVLHGKILEDVPYIPQRIMLNGKYSPHRDGSSMCSGASVAMIADYYGKLPSRTPNIQKINGVDTDLNLREYVWQDKGQNLNKSCYFSKPIFKIDGSFAMTSNQGCSLGHFNKYIEYFGHFGLKTKNMKPGNEESYSYSKIKESIGRNHPVLSGEPGHIMVVVGYLDFPEKYKTNIVVDIEKEGVIIQSQVNVTKDFILIFNDPKRNRNRTGDIGYFDSDGRHSAYLIVKEQTLNGFREHMCRSGTGWQGLDRKYVCTPAGSTALEIYQ